MQLSLRSDRDVPVGGSLGGLWTVAAVAASISTVATVFFWLDKPLFFVAALVGIVGVVPIFREPRLGFYATVATIPLDEVAELGKILPMVDISIPKIFALLTIAAWAVHLVTRRMQFVWNRAATIFVVYLVIGALTILDALEVQRSLQELVIQGTTIVFFVLVFNMIREKRHLLIALALFSAVSVGTFAWAGIQRFLPGAEIQERIGWLAEGESEAGVEVSNIESQNLGKTVRRSTGTTAHSNVLATNTALLVPVLLAFMRFSRHVLLELLLWGGIACCCVGAITSLSRTGMLTYVIILPMVLYTRLLIVTPFRVALVAIAAVASIPFLPDGVARIFDISNYFSTNSVSVSERYKLWDAALRAFLDNPLSGFGIGNNRGILDYYIDPWNPGLLTVHNSYLQIVIETGIFGLLTMLVFFGTVLYLFFLARRRFVRQGDHVGATFSSALMISTIAFLLIGGIAFDLMRIGFKNMWLVMGCSVALYHMAVRADEARAGAGTSAAAATGTAGGRAA
jgi:hypothetical protein